jgi:hypothetical protein
VTLTAGWHALEVIYVARTGYAIMKLEWDPAGGTNYADIPAARLRSKALPAGWEGVAETCGVHTYYPDQELLDLDAPDCNIALVNGQYQPKAGLGSHPVVEVTWYGAKAYCRWLAECTGQPVDLPDEWLWEYAASGGDSTIAGNYYPWGPKFGGATHDKANYYGTGGIDIYNGTAPAGLFPTYFGLQDMAGNVWEWTSSPLSLGSSFRVVRGGSWNQPADPYMATSGRQVYKDENFGDKNHRFPAGGGLRGDAVPRDGLCPGCGHPTHDECEQFVSRVYRADQGLPDQGHRSHQRRVYRVSELGVGPRIHHAQR